MFRFTLSSKLTVTGVGLILGGLLLAEPAPPPPPGAQPPAVVQSAPPPAAPLPTVQPPTITAQPAQPASPAKASLVFDSKSKEYFVKQGESNAYYTFYVTNVSSADVLINSVVTSCGCTAAQLPATPWRLSPGASGPIGVTMDIRGKVGPVTKTVTINASTGSETLMVTARVPAPDLLAMDPAQRARNQEVAKADRHAVWKADCARCHAAPAAGKMDAALYRAVCGVCHEAEHRAPMVPDLRALKRPPNREYWADTIMHGKPATLMPGCSQVHGGPLTDDQIFSLVEYMVGPFQQTIKTAAGPATPASP